MLTIKDIHVSYGQAPALHGVSLEAPEGEVVTILGANGAGKSTTIRAVAGLLPVLAGSIEFAGQDITRLSTEAIVRLGICAVPEGRQLFGEMTVLENLRLEPTPAARERTSVNRWTGCSLTSRRWKNGCPCRRTC